MKSLEMVMFLPLSRGFKIIPHWWDLPTRTRLRDGEAGITELPPWYILCKHPTEGTLAEKDSLVSPFL